jgi:peptidylprolyl isomerase
MYYVSSGLRGPVNVGKQNKTLSIRVANDVPKASRISLEVMKTSSRSFKILIKSSKNRQDACFLHQHDYIDACSVTVPYRLKGSHIKSFK